MAPAGSYWDGRPVYNWTAAGSVLLVSLDLAATPSLAGRAVYVALTARVPHGAHLTLAIDPGDGDFRYSDDGAGSGEGGSVWQVKSYQAILASNGTARFAAFSWHAASGGSGDAVQLSGPVAVAAVGTPFSGAAVNRD